MDYNWILRPVIGAVIGYSTNWLAIKMLFRPYEEKRFLGVKIPFTPGVIPRERERIANSLGSAVGEQLLTEQVIKDELLNDSVTEHIKSYVIQDLLQDAFSLEDLMTGVFHGQGTKILGGITNQIAGEIGVYLNAPTTKDNLRQTIGDYLSQSAPYNTPIGNLLTENMSEEMTGVVRCNMEGINGYVLTQLNQEGVKGKIAQAIEKLVLEKVGALGAMFLDPVNMADSVIDYIGGMLQEEETQTAIAGAVGGGLSLLREQNLSETVSLGLYQETVTAITDRIVDGIYNQVSEENLTDLVEPLVQRMVQKKIYLSDDQKVMIEDQVEVLYRNFIEKNISTFLETFEVSSVVENEINQFSVMDIEKLIFNIVDQELQAITWLGGLLGFVIGLVYVFI